MLCGEAFISQITANQIGQDKAAVITQMRRIVNGGTTGMYGYLTGLERFKNGLLPFYDIIKVKGRKLFFKCVQRSAQVSFTAIRKNDHDQPFR